MAVCVSVDPITDVLHLDTATQPPDCVYMVVQQGDLFTLPGLTSFMDQYFAFDPELWGIVIGANLVTFATGHVLGRMMQAWRKVM